jgi:mannose-6-phosphate isomerase-like protein (cupin superfamily)
MSNYSTKWALGHKVTLYDTAGDFDLSIIETPPKVQGPPPHIHKSYKESFVIIEGEMQFFIDGEVYTKKAGEVIDIPPHTLHTFENKSEKKCRFANIHSPKGFRAFFESVGVSEEETDAEITSVSPELVQQVIRTAADFDMHIKM